jgi:hypothetical protein
MARVMERPDRDPDLELGDDVAEADAEIDGEPGEFDLPGPDPVMDQDPEEFQVMSAADAGPLPPDVDRELDQLADALETALDDPDGMIATRFGRRVIVAPVGNPNDHVDVADVDMPRHMVLTFGGEDPTPQGSLLAQVLFQRREMSHGYVHAPDVKGPTFSVLQRVLPSLHGTGAVELEEIGTLALGHRPAEIAGALQGLQADEDDEDNEAEGPDPNQVR